MPTPSGLTPRSLPPVIPPRRYNRTGLYLAFAIAAACVPFTLKYQTKHVPNMTNRRWQMLNLQSVTSTEAIKRFGEPSQIRDYSLAEGSFAGPRVGLKHFYRVNSPEYAQRMKEPVVWSFPDYSMIRELTWKLPDSSLTIWLHEPRAQISLEGDNSQIYLPQVGEGEWVALDNYRIGNDLLKVPPTSK